MSFSERAAQYEIANQLRLEADYVMQLKVVYSVLQVLYWVTIRKLGTRIAEYKEACSRGEWEESAIAEHPIESEDTRIIDRASRRMEVDIKEALHIGLTPSEDHMNRDVGSELPGCWVSTIKSLASR